MRHLWSSALTILEGDYRAGKQMLPQDLDNEEYYGRQHIGTLLTMQCKNGGEEMFLDLARPFLLVLTHSSFLGCLSADTSVGALYNFISGTNGTRAVPFFQRLCEILSDILKKSTFHILVEHLEEILVATSVALCEVLKREQRARFNEDLPELVDRLEHVASQVLARGSNGVIQSVFNQVVQMRGMIARAKGLLAEDEPQKNSVFTTAITSTYPRQIKIPHGHHDNDKADITQIKIFPTLDEIMSIETEFLPSTNPEQPHFLSDQAERHIDTHFRLLRHDTFGEMKQVLGGLMHAIRDDATVLSNPKFALGDFRAFPYAEAYVRATSFESRRGLEAHISFPQPALLRNKSSLERRKWWEETKRLSEGILLSWISAHDNVISHLFFIVTGKYTDTKAETSLSSNSHQATIVARLAREDQKDVEAMIHLAYRQAPGLLVEFPNILPATFVPILENLQEMQLESRLPFRDWIVPARTTGSVPAQNALKIPPPLYAQNPWFKFSLAPILKNKTNIQFAGSRVWTGDDDDDDYDKYGAEGDALSVNPTDLSGDNESLLDRMSDQTQLDRGQCRALISGLSKELALVQGPPGTGKSFLGVQLSKVLLASKLKADLGPIVVVCYTNHALDQFLEHLLENGIRNVVRIGGQSQSKILEEHNLRRVSQLEGRTGHEGYLLHKTYESLASLEETINTGLDQLRALERGADWKHLKHHLSRHYSSIYHQFSEVDEEGFKVVGPHPFERWRNSGSHQEPRRAASQAAPLDNIEHIRSKALRNVHYLSQPERDILLQSWKQEVYENTADELFEFVKEARSVQRQVTHIHDEGDRRALENADIIGVTTSGLAKRIHTLKHVSCKVVICEEAGEVMEAHLLSALLPGVEHFIQIGDHEQLRPQINNYSLSLESNQGALYQLDRSQFERLSVGQRGIPAIPVAQLDIQRRMRPEISTLIRETLYPNLIDHPTTGQIPHVVGMRKDLFWLDHDNLQEGGKSESHHKSHSNLWEVNMVHSLVRHIIRQGVYNSSDIAVLTPYTGQLQKLRATMRNDFEIVLSDRDQQALERDGFDMGGTASRNEDTVNMMGNKQTPLQKVALSELLRVATVDNFQGEEAKIVIVSLVRSNKERKVGFLRTTNRINVLLSRAQHGMYLIGNAETYSNIPMWQQVIGMLRGSDSVGQAFGLCCPRHPDTEIQVRQPEEFAILSPEGGCKLSCDRRLPNCGHKCQARCHSETMHRAFACPQPCQRLHHPCDHACPKLCGEDCGRCVVQLNDIRLPCGHIKASVFCYEAKDIASIMCDVKVFKTVRECMHTMEVRCCQNVASEYFECSAPCETILKCGHVCPGTCGRCNKEDQDNRITTAHMACQKVCGRRFGTCNHCCKRRCHDGEECGPCVSPCEVRCAHSRCTLRCQEACAPCVELCTWSCEHMGECGMPCSAPCDRLPCDQRCSKLLQCGHQCPGLCGEICPEKYCHICSEKQDSRVDLLEMKTYGEIDVNETPIVVLGCGHFFTTETLDGLIGMTEVYSINQLGAFDGLKCISTALAHSIPRCPDCQCPVRQYVTPRYNRIINRAVMDEMSKRFVVNGKTELQQLEKRLTALEEALEKSRLNITDSITAVATATHGRGSWVVDRQFQRIDNALQDRYGAPRRFERAVILFQRSIDDRHQPARKLHDATVHAIRNKPLDALMTNLNVAHSLPDVPLDRQIAMGGKMIQIKTECAILEDKFEIARALHSTSASTSVKIPGVAPHRLAKPFLQMCKSFIAACNTESLPKYAVEASLYYGKIARLFQASCHMAKEDMEGSEYVKTAKEFLDHAKELCDEPFQNADILRKAAEDLNELLGREWYESVTDEEIAQIKAAMVSGSGGIVTHSGHWYNCANGHPFAIGDCGMPMEQARCPECGAPIGGQHHTAVAGVTRATNMER
jgi:hypothetical protein